MLWVSCLFQSKHSMWWTGEAPNTVRICSLLSPAFMALVINAPHTEPGDAPKWTVEPFLLSMAFGCSSAAVLTTPAVQTLERMRDEEPKKAGSTEALGCLTPCCRETSIQDKICSACLTLPQGKVLALFPGTPILFQESEIDWHCFPRPRGCALSVPSLQSLPRGAYGVGCPACAHIGKGVTILLTSANPARHANGQQSVMLTCSVADGTWDWLSPSHPPRLIYKTGKEFFLCTPARS